jgi:CRISPR/Cas system-associated exonuclease Cas4 (RecB family)
VKIDCAVEIEGKFFLIDWKTSNSKLAVEDGLQVAALYAHEVWGAEPDKIQGTAISLLDGAAHHAHIDEDSLMQTFLKIQEESARLEELRNAMAQIASYAELPMAPADTCRQCSFQKICHAD